MRSSALEAFGSHICELDWSSVKNASTASGKVDEFLKVINELI